MRVLVTGPRGWRDLPTLQHALLDARDQPPPEAMFSTMLVVTGGCPEGLDAMAERVARQWRWDVEVHPADLRAHAGTGMFRNSHLVNLGAHLCLAFAMPCDDARCSEPRPHLTHGTRDCARKARDAGIPVRWYTHAGVSSPGVRSGA